MTVPHFHAVALAAAESDLLASIPAHFAWRVAERLKLDIFMPPVESTAMDIKMYWHKRMDCDPGHLWLRECIAEILSSGPPGR
jgi:DNA-binding transcriptional LysR family regulator